MREDDCSPWLVFRASFCTRETMKTEELSVQTRFLLCADKLTGGSLSIPAHAEEKQASFSLDCWETVAWRRFVFRLCVLHDFTPSHRPWFRCIQESVSPSFTLLPVSDQIGSSCFLPHLAFHHKRSSWDKVLKSRYILGYVFPSFSFTFLK